jgi:hypothetical protein
MSRLTQYELLSLRFDHCYHDLRKCSAVLFENINRDLDKTNELNLPKYDAHELIRKMYYIICAYLELSGYAQFLSSFKERFQMDIDSRDKALAMSTYSLPDGTTEKDFKLIRDWKVILTPFDLFNYQLGEKELERLERLLIAMPKFLAAYNVININKTSLIDTVRKVLKLFYKEVHTNGPSTGIHSYDPDTALWDEGIIIENKLIRKEEEISKKINGIIMDVEDYGRDGPHRSYITAFYLGNNIVTTPQKLYDDWKKLGLPENWRLVVVGPIEIPPSKAKVPSEIQ